MGGRQRLRESVNTGAARARMHPQLRRVHTRLLDPVARHDRRDGKRLRRLLASELASDANCIDVGAHRGDVLREMVRRAPDGRHIAFEPLPQLCRELARAFPDVDVRRAALWNEDGESSFVHVTSAPAYSGLRRRPLPQPELTEELTVATERLDSVLPDGYVPSFIKVDVEGAEGQVFEGAIETLTRHRPIVFFEHSYGGADQFATSPADVYELLVGQAGLRIFDVDGRGPYSGSDFDEVFRAPIWNFVARP